MSTLVFSDTMQRTQPLLGRVWKYEKIKGITMERAYKGLFHGKHVRFGTRTCFSEKKSRRRWNPNIVTKKFTSEILERKITIKISTKAQRTIDKRGGFDNYILKTHTKLLPGIGTDLQNQMKQTLAFHQLIKKWDEEEIALGLKKLGGEAEAERQEMSSSQ
eukprot:gb/GEZN01021991.1/.p1 GENE.gb/GEZN01021991.1/~~gb/GEZN01021991.1/.p1  ORF type:complete len:161 (-),score=24.93 gb/GEZN01021991.1/:117-599(-)